MRLLFVLVALLLTGVNTFGSWAVSRRRPLVARLFLLAAALLTVAAVAYAYGVQEARWFLAGGALATFVASYLNARLVIGRVEWRNHALRLLLLTVAVVAAFAANS